jgi:putative SOS response-associated peptidase YedK
MAPTQAAPIVRQRDGARVLEFAKWALTPPWAAGAGQINPRAETAATNAMCRSAFKNGRCVVPASGFYEWQRLDASPKPRKQPWYIHRADGAPLLFAGLRERGKDGDTFAIITTDANGFMRPIHDRMPAVLEPKSVTAWLAEPDPALLAPAADDATDTRR